MTSEAPWPEEYYRAVEHYFWTPSAINRRPMEPLKRKSFEAVMKMVRHREVPLNHIFNLFLSLAPNGLVRRLIKSCAPEWRDENLRLFGRAAIRITPETDICQPDIYMEGTKSRVAFELKIAAKTSPDQIIKYALLLNDYQSTADAVSEKRHLIFLGPTTASIWPKGMTLATCLSGLAAGNLSPGVRRYCDTMGHSSEFVIGLTRALRISSAAFSGVYALLEVERAMLRDDEVSETLGLLIDGLRQELRCRGLHEAH
jgi:hypothetical protein